jgi:ABC-2 type transport system permease protein
MYLSLVKKDFDLVFQENSGIIIAQMFFILIIISVNLGIVGYGVMATSFGWQLLMSVSTKEKENHSLALLISMPYEKGKIITTRYVSTMAALLGITLIYQVIAWLTNMFNIPLFAMLTSEIVLTTMCAYALFISITLPLYFKFDNSTVIVFSMILILGVTMVGLLLWDRTDICTRIEAIHVVNEHFKIICIVVTIISLVISRNISLQLFKKMEF